MKKIAYIYYDNEMITIYQALKLKKENPEVWANRDFYDIVNHRAMRPVNRHGDSSSFSFKCQGASGHGKGSKGIVHELVQHNLCLKKEFSFYVYGKRIDIVIKNAFEEWHVFDLNNKSRKAFIDCCLELDPACQWYEFFGGKIGFEITDTHATTNKKKKLFKDLNIFVFELVAIDEWHIKNEVNVTAQQLKILRARIEGYLNSCQNMTVLSQSKRI